MQNNDRKSKAPVILDQASSPQDIRVDRAQTQAGKTETAPLVDDPLFLRCFANAPNAFVS